MNSNIPSIEELKERLNQENSDIRKDILEGIARLTEIDFSILRKEAIDEEKRELYGLVEVYQDVVKRNVYQSINRIIEQEKDKYNLEIKNIYNGTMLLGITPKNKAFNIMSFIHLPNYKESFDLFEYKENSIKRDKEKERILSELDYMEKLLNENPELKKWQDIINKKEWLENRYIELDDRKEMPEEEKYISGVQNYFARLFENEFGIDRKKDYTDISKRMPKRYENDGMHKILNKEYPTLTLKKDVRYY